MNHFSAAERLVDLVFPIMFAWFYLGFIIAVLYHLSLYVICGEFRGKERELDVAVAILRGVLYVCVWPAIFYFDRSAAYRIKLFFLYLVPKNREGNEELRSALREREYRTWARRSFLDKLGLEDRRRTELETGRELTRRSRVLHEGNPELDRTWLLTGVGIHPMGASELVRLYPNYHLVDEIEDGVRREIRIRRLYKCAQCGTPVPGGDVKIPGVEFLRILEPDSDRKVIEGWAIRGEYELQYEPCPECGVVPPVETGDLVRFGRASDIVRVAHTGMVLHWDLP